jgi:cell wall-associated NlpC family hydrolase
MSRRRCRTLAPIRAWPRDDAEQVSQALRGEPLRVEETREGWARVLTEYGYPGWVRVDALGDEFDGPWLELRAGDPVESARDYVGAPYEWGGMTQAGIDCSGLVHMAYRELGRLVPRDAAQQEAAGVEVAPGDVRPGDLVCYGEADCDHVAFWLGDGRILHATGRDGVRATIEEEQPPELEARFRRFVRL